VSFFFQEVFGGLVAGSTYALVALGFTLVFGVLRVLNLAHPDIYMWAAFVAFAVAKSGAPPWFVALSAVLGGAVWGLLIDRFVLRYLRESAMATPFIATMGLSLFLQNLSVRVFGPQPLPMPQMLPHGTLHLGTFELGYGQIITVISALALMLALWLFVEGTWFGKAIRATSENAEIARALGINADLVSMSTVIIASAFAGAAGFLISTLYGQVFAFMGVPIGLKAMVVMMVGGLGNVPGAVLGGFVLGILESLTVGYISSSYRDAIAFIVLMIVLLVRPQGLLGERLRRK
jgi:branched-chain amino acid transport system permease protein